MRGVAGRGTLTSVVLIVGELQPCLVRIASSTALRALIQLSKVLDNNLGRRSDVRRSTVSLHSALQVSELHIKSLTSSKISRHNLVTSLLDVLRICGLDLLQLSFSFIVDSIDLDGIVLSSNRFIDESQTVRFFIVEDVLVLGVVGVVRWQSTGQLERDIIADVVVGAILPLILLIVINTVAVLLNLLGQRNGVLLDGHIRSILTVSIQNHLRHGLTVSACSLSLNNQVVALLGIREHRMIPLGFVRRINQRCVSVLISLGLIQLAIGLKSIGSVKLFTNLLSERASSHLTSCERSAIFLDVICNVIDNRLVLDCNSSTISSWNSVSLQLVNGIGKHITVLFIDSVGVVRRLVRSFTFDGGGQVQQLVGTELITLRRISDGDIGSRGCRFRHGGGGAGETGDGHRCGGCHSDEALENLIHCSPFLRNRNYFFLFHSYSVIA